MGEESEGTGKVKSTSKAQRVSIKATFEGEMSPQSREQLIAGVKKLANDCGIEVTITY